MPMVRVSNGGTSANKGTFTASGGTTSTVTLGYQPTAVHLWHESSGAYKNFVIVYDTTISSTAWKFLMTNVASGVSSGTVHMLTTNLNTESSSANIKFNVTSTGFTLYLANALAGQDGTWYYCAAK